MVCRPAASNANAEIKTIPFIFFLLKVNNDPKVEMMQNNEKYFEGETDKMKVETTDRRVYLPDNHARKCLLLALLTVIFSA